MVGRYNELAEVGLSWADVNRLELILSPASKQIVHSWLDHRRDAIDSEHKQRILIYQPLMAAAMVRNA